MFSELRLCPSRADLNGVFVGFPFFETCRPMLAYFITGSITYAKPLKQRGRLSRSAVMPSLADAFRRLSPCAVVADERVAWAGDGEVEESIQSKSPKPELVFNT